ncbi:MAG: ChaN family lipoprotein [Bacteroidales bacterium]|nr:ChaN family lipoprotein [Bacteroidales bacterium]MCF8327221.1 ChaN family lipoprotein [Bacteroidales bacterium]
MIKKIILIITLGIFSLTAFSQKSAFKLYTADGSEADYTSLVESSVSSDIILFGEHHNNPVCHWLQLELTMDLHKEIGDSLVLGAEMFEHDNQVILNEYLNDKISARSFKGQARLWPNYETDYKPLVEFAKSNGLPFIATNIPRRYAAMIASEGFSGLDSIDKQAKDWIAPLPIPYDAQLPGYKKMLKMMGRKKANPNLPKAQAIKDATMAYFILENLNEEQVFLHFNGTYHSNNYEGISWYLKEYEPDVQITTIATVEQENIEVLLDKNKKLADYILVIPENMTKTY